MGDLKSSIYIDNIYENEFRNILNVYKKALELISAKQKKFKKIAEHPGTPVLVGVRRFIELEHEITELETIYLEIEKFKKNVCTTQDVEMINCLLEGLSVPKIAQLLLISQRTVYRRIAKITKNFFNCQNNLGGEIWQKQQEQQQREM